MLGPLGNHTGDQAGDNPDVMEENDGGGADTNDGFKKMKMRSCQEWELENEAEKVLAKGSHLAEVCCIHLV